MQKKQHELPMHIYHRIYRFSRRNVEPDRIALTLDLPLKTVQRVLERFAHAQKHGGLEHLVGDLASAEKEPQTFLDIYVAPKVRYVVADISGWAVAEHALYLKERLHEIGRSQWKVIALLMRDVISLDDAAAEVIVSFHDELVARGRYTAILDPSRQTEEYISEHQIEEKVPVFGTEKTFEDEAFSTRRHDKRRPATR